MQFGNDRLKKYSIKDVVREKKKWLDLYMVTDRVYWLL